MRATRIFAAPIVVLATISAIATLATSAEARVVHGLVQAHSAAFVGGSYDVGDGLRISIAVSDAVPDALGEARTWASFYKGLPHGSEIARIRIRVVPMTEITRQCGDGTYGCYDSGSEIVVIPPSSYEYSRVTAAHEYGHHLANNRLNTPWDAVDWGTKRWATYENVCARTRAKTAFPGDEDREYGRNPGEAFAESYAALSGYEYDDTTFSKSFKPTKKALELIRQDVLSPWTQATVTTKKGRFTKSDKSRRVSIATPLDGIGRVTVESSLALDADLRLYSSAGRLIGRSATDSHRESAGYTICGTRGLWANLLRYDGAGTYTLTSSQP